MPPRPEEQPPIVPPSPQGLPSFEQLVAETSADLYRLALRLTGDPAAASDVLQTTYLRAFEGLRAGTFRGECKLETWLYRIVMHAAFDARRADRRRDLLHQAARCDDAAPERLEATVELSELRSALATLPEEQRSALVLKELHGLTGRQTAEVMERSEGAVEQLLVRARAELRRRFER